MDPRRAIPAVERLLGSPEFAALLEVEPRGSVVEALKAVQAELRATLAGGGAAPEGIAAPGWYVERVRDRLAAWRRPSIRRAINATGVVLHTNLGRAPLAAAARAAMERAALSYTNLEYDLDTGERGSRYDHCARLLAELTGAEAALVVNNNAAAVVLALNTVAEGREAIVSRGELVEIGGSFRIPDIMAKSGARLVEVGTTNKTHPSDYLERINERTGAILKVHRSNFRMTGFTAEVPVGTLAGMVAGRGIPVINDLGSGLLLDAAWLGLPYEPTAADAIRAGADVVTMSGDKLLGGPQAGIIVGRAELIGRMRKNPLCRALRVDRVRLAALEATLALYREPDRARREVPVLRMLTYSAEEIEARARPVAEALAAGGYRVELVSGASAVGGGAYPDHPLPTCLIALEAPGLSADALEARFRAGDPPVVGRITDGRVVLDLRTVLPEEEAALVEVACGALEGG